MYMSLQDLRDKFTTDKTFAQQFVRDASEVGVNVNILTETGEIDKDLLEGNVNLLNTYVNVVSKIIENKPAGATRRLASYIHAPFYREEDFSFDPDTRIITVPKDFAKNGVAVVGDHLAELLFFKMPRFFDVVDLYKCDILIYWHNTSLKDEAEPHVSMPIAKYPEGDELHFGWYLTEDATSVAGQIEFAIEFSINNEETGLPNFRLYSQPAKITVKNSIDMDADGVIPENNEDLIFSRAIYSNIVNLLTAAPAVITENLDDVNDLNLDPETGTITLHIDAMIPSEEQETNGLIMGWNWNSVMIDQPEGDIVNNKARLANNVITYELDSKDELGNEKKIIIFSDPVDVEVTPGEPTYTYTAIVDTSEVINPAALGLYERVNEEYVLTEDTEVDSEKTYYRLDVTAGTATNTAAVGTTYKTLTTNVPGQYMVYVGNVVKDTSSDNYGGIRYVNSRVAKIAPASDIEISNKELPVVTYLDNWENRTPIMTVYIEGANGKVYCDWYHGDEIIRTTEAVPVIENGVETGEYKAQYDPSENQLPARLTDKTLRGWYKVEARNVKNNTVKRAMSPQCFVEVMPLKIADADLSVRAISESDHLFEVAVAQPQHEGITYEITGSLRTHYIYQGEERVKETPIYFNDQRLTKWYFDAKDEEGNGHNGIFAFSLNEATRTAAGLTEGSQYSLFISVVPITQYNEGLERYAVRIDASSGAIIPDRTYAQIPQLTY